MGEMPVRRIWTLSNSGLGTTISASGNSGGYATTGPPPWTPDNLSAIDLRYVEDLFLSVFVAGTAGSTITVGLSVFDDLGNVFAIPGSSVTVTAAGAAGAKFISIGKHGGAATATSYTVFPEWGQVVWSSVTGTFTGTEIALYGR